MLDRDYRPVAAPDRPALRPRFPTRYRAWMYAMARVAAIMDGKMKDGTPSVTDGNSRSRRSSRRGRKGR